MKIAVCVKEVPDAGPNRRIDPGTLRMDRSGDRSLNPYDLHAVEQALRLKEAAGDGEVVLVSMGASRALESLRKGLAMGADRALLVSDEAAAGSDLVATSTVLAAALAGRVARPGAVRPAGHRRRRRRAVGRGGRPPASMPVISQISELEVERRQRDRQAPDRVRLRHASAPRCPAVLAVADSLNEPRYPSLKGIMGAKKKPQDDEEPRRHRRRRRPRRRGRAPAPRSSASASRPRAATRSRSRTTATRRPEDPRLPHGKEARMSTLVFLEHHGSSHPEGRARRAHQGRPLDPDTSARPRSAPACASSPPSAGKYGAATVFVADDAAPRGARSRSRAWTSSARSCRTRASTPCSSAASVLAADVAGGLSARLDAGLNWDLNDLESDGGDLVGKRSALGDTVRADVGWTRRAAASAWSAPARSTPPRPAARPRSRTSPCRSRTSPPRPRWSSRPTRSRPAPRSRTPTSWSPAAAASARPEDFSLARGAGRGARRRRRLDPRGGGLRLVPLPDPDRPDRQGRLAEALHRRSASRARSSTRSACRPRR